MKKNRKNNIIILIIIILFILISKSQKFPIQSSWGTLQECPEGYNLITENRQYKVNDILDILVVVDTRTQDLSDGEINDILSVVDHELYRLTGYHSSVLRICRIPNDGSTQGYDGELMAECIKFGDYLPEGIILFGEGQNGAAAIMGGYFKPFAYILGYTHNEFKIPFTSTLSIPVYSFHNHSILLGGVVDSNSYYAECNSSVSTGGECRGQEGIPCDWIEEYGIYRCSNVPVDDLYVNQDYYLSSIIIHELAHGFEMAAGAHYGTPDCEALGYPYVSDLDAQLHMGMCPYVYTNFHPRPENVFCGDGLCQTTEIVDNPGITLENRCEPINGCTPQTCIDLGKDCGSWSDGCGGTIDCGICPTNGTTPSKDKWYESPMIWIMLFIAFLLFK